MKFAEKIFPLGTFKGQQTDGAYIDRTLAINLDIYAKKIADDMHFLGIITGSDGVGNGKSTMAQHIGCYLTAKINELHGVNNTFTHNNIFFNSKQLVNKSMKLPAYSVICLDEGDDLTTHGMKELAIRLKRYFRKCRQLNQIIILILPSFFELPKFYALSRSHFLINVSFQGEYERGFFNFYGPQSKKLLYLKGKKEWDYNAHPSDFGGRFFGSYCFFPDINYEVERYRDNKYKDMIDDSKEQQDSKSVTQIKRERDIWLFNRLHMKLKEITIKRLADAFGVSDRTGFSWLNDSKYKEIRGGMLNVEAEDDSNNNPNEEDRDDEDEGDVQP